MVSTRKPAPSTALTSTQTARGEKLSGAPPTQSLSSAQPPPESSVAKVTRSIDSRLRKRGRNEFVGNNEAPLSSSLSLGEQDPNSKRAKTQASPAEGRYTRRRAQNIVQDTANPTAPDMTPDSGQILFNTPIPNMTDFDGTANNDTVSPGYRAMSRDDSVSISLHGLQLGNQSLPVLDNFATQILSVTATTSYQELFNMATTPQTGPGQQWSQLITLFSETKKVYACHDPFLSSKKLGFVEKAHVDTIKKANMATFICGLFGGREDVGFGHLNEFFLDTFAVEGAKMLKSHAQLFLDLKTQAYISAVTSDKDARINGHRSREEVLDALFPPQLDKYLVARRSGATHCTPIERQFIERVRNRRGALLEGSGSEAAIEILPKTHPWEDFLKGIHNHIATNFDDIIGNTTPKALRPGKAANPAGAGRKTQVQIAFHTLQEDQDQQSQSFVNLEQTQLQSAPSASDDIAEKAARAAHFAMETFSSAVPQNPAVETSSQTRQNGQALSQHRDQTSQAAGPPIQFHFERPLHPNVPSPPAPFFTQIPYQNGQMQGQWHPSSGADGQFHQSYDAQGMIPYPTQSAPTHVLYERARQAASTKPSQQHTPRKATTNTPTQRRPWTSEEENALMAGLDRVKGPHWSQIHAMFGPGGNINEVLKDRSQVQLKDKARNLKLFFLKSNIEVPYYLQFVTGELKTRAPSRLAKNEAREKAMSEEDRAHVQGVITLAGTAMQESDQTKFSLEDAEGERDQIGLGLSSPSANDVNIDPSLEEQLQNAVNRDEAFSSRYTVPTPNMIMQSLDKFSGDQDMAEKLQR